MKYHVYILFSNSGKRYYIGQTNNIETRIGRHNLGLNFSTASYKPWELILVIEKSTRSESIMLEKKLKNLNTEDLEKFIKKYKN